MRSMRNDPKVGKKKALLSPFPPFFLSIRHLTTVSRKKAFATKGSCFSIQLKKLVTRSGFEPLYDSVKGCCVIPLHQRAM